MLKSLIVSFMLLAVFVSATTTKAMAQGIEAPIQITPTLWIMGMPAEEDIAKFADEGGDMVISLLSADELADIKETEWSTRHQLAFYHVPVDGAKGVTFDNARLLDKLLLMNSDKRILVHCSSSNRVGALFALRAAWLDGQSTEKALKIGREHGMTSLEPKVSKMLAE